MEQEIESGLSCSFCPLNPLPLRTPSDASAIAGDRISPAAFKIHGGALRANAGRGIRLAHPFYRSKKDGRGFMETMRSDLVTCSCNNCDGHLEFERHQAGQQVNCPHCGMETLLFVPSNAPPKVQSPPPVSTAQGEAVFLSEGGITVTKTRFMVAYSDGCRTPIPIHIGQSFQFKADTCSD